MNSDNLMLTSGWNNDTLHPPPLPQPSYLMNELTNKDPYKQAKLTPNFPLSIYLLSCLLCPSKMGIDFTAFGLPILLTSGNALNPICFLWIFYLLSLSLYYDVNGIGRPKAVTFIPIFLEGTKHIYYIHVFFSGDFSSFAKNKPSSIFYYSIYYCIYAFIFFFLMLMNFS